MLNISFKINRRTLAALKSEAEKEDKTLSDIIRKYLPSEPANFEEIEND